MTDTSNIADECGKINASECPNLIKPLKMPTMISTVQAEIVKNRFDQLTNQQLGEAFDYFNSRHFVVPVKGKTFIANINWENMSDPTKFLISFSHKDDFKDFYAGKMDFEATDYSKAKRRDTGEHPQVLVEVAGHWLKSAKRRTHSELILDPSKTFGGVDGGPFNLWTGWGGGAFEPQEGDWSTIRAFYWNDLAAGDEGIFEWRLNLMAYWVQHLNEPGHVADTLGGKKGTGKGTHGETIWGRILGRHALHIHNANDLLGHFGGHLIDKFLVFVDEAAGVEIERNVGRFQGMITDKRFTLEEKYWPRVEVPNKLHIVLGSNLPRIVPVSADERRYFASRTSDQHRVVADGRASDVENRQYWARLNAALDKELPGFLHHLLKERNVSAFDVRTPPLTKGLIDLKIASLKGVARWWFECLKEGYLGENGGWKSVIAKKELYSAYKEDVGRWAATQSKFGTDLKKALNIPDEERMPTKRIGSDPRAYVLPPLKEARERFEAAEGLKGYQWPDMAPEAPQRTGARAVFTLTAPQCDPNPTEVFHTAFQGRAGLERVEPSRAAQSDIVVRGRHWSEMPPESERWAERQRERGEVH